MKTSKMFEVVVSDEFCHSFDGLMVSLERETRLCGGLFAESIQNGRQVICMAVNEKFRPYFVERVRDEVADFVAVEHKFDFFMDRLNLPVLSENKKIGFCSALAVFDKATDIKYIKKRLLFDREIYIDSAIMFCMPELLERWKEIATLVCENGVELSGEKGMMEMMRFLLKSSASENETMHLASSDGKFFIVNDKKDPIFTFEKEEKGKLLHRTISLLPKHLAVHGSDFDFFYELFPSENKNEMSLTK